MHSKKINNVCKRVWKQEYPDTHLLSRYCIYSVAQVLALYFKFAYSIQK